MLSLSLAEATELVSGSLRGEGSFTGLSSDSRAIEPGQLFVALSGPNFDGHDFLAQVSQQGAAGALVSRWCDVELAQIRVADTLRALGQLGAAWRRRFQLPLIGLTGSNGKTTVKEMIAAILRTKGSVLATKGNLNNEIGLPLTLARLAPEYDYAVIEMGANHPGEIAYLAALAKPNVALITNAGPAHLEGFGDLDGVARSKAEIYQSLPTDSGIAIINHDDNYAGFWRDLVAKQGCKAIEFGLSPEASVSGELLEAGSFRLSIATDNINIQLPLPGRHNIQNALAAAAATHVIGASLAEIKQGLEGIETVSGRLQTLPGIAGSTLINDAYNANPASLLAGLETINTDSDLWLVLGDMAELGPDSETLHRAAGEQIRAHGIQRLYAYGELTQATTAAFGAGSVHCQRIEALIDALQHSLRENADNPPTLLIKGSRSMRMERVVDALKEPAPC